MPNWSPMSLAGDADTDSAHRYLQYSDECETLVLLDKVFHAKREEPAGSVPVCGKQPGL
jgi:hypothetical protein